MTLVDIIETWLDNEPQYSKHFRIVTSENSNFGDSPLWWIACGCKNNSEIPPTPIYDILILSSYIDVWNKSTLQETIVSATDPSFFEQLSKYLDNCHDSNIN